jgi:hypothetical protein
MQATAAPVRVPRALVVSAVIGLSACLLSAFSCASCTVGGSEPEPPEIACQGAPASWQGIIPGQSTTTDVIETLGEPVQGRDTRVFLYPPIVFLVDGTSYGNTIAFNGAGIVDWIDVWVLDSDGEFHTVGEMARIYGTTLDRVYVNGRLGLSGPDQVYVWSHCGIAVTAVSEGRVKHSEDEILPLAEAVEANQYQLNLRHPVHPQDPVQPTVDVRQIVVRRFIFEPTSYASFVEFYAKEIPFMATYFHDIRLAGK